MARRSRPGNGTAIGTAVRRVNSVPVWEGRLWQQAAAAKQALERNEQAARRYRPRECPPSAAVPASAVKMVVGQEWECHAVAEEVKDGR